MEIHAHKTEKGKFYSNILKLLAVVGGISLLSLNFFLWLSQNNAPKYAVLSPTVNHTHNATKDVTKTKEDDFLDFFIMGFPKCGTTSMMHFFQKVHETSIIWKETFPQGKDGKIVYIKEYSLLQKGEAKTLVKQIKVASKTNNETKKFGIKWPTALEYPSVIRDLIGIDKRHKNTKIIIGMRHPVKWFESFYNYRLLTSKMPPANKLIGGREVAKDGVFTGLAQYEKYFMQFGKVDLTPHELSMLSNHKPATTLLSTPNKIFLYTVEQFKDKNVTRADSFLKDLASFMEIEETFTSDMMPKSNSVNNKRFKICDDEHKEVRKVLVENGKVTANWFQAKFSEEIDDVVIGGREHFFQLLETWKEDPCVDKVPSQRVRRSREP